MISVDAPPRPELSNTRALGLLSALFVRLHAERIMYCHWKSNEHLRASMLGATDLDLLVDPGSAARLPLLLEEQGFKRFQAKPGRGYPGIEDYVGFDVESGQLSHLHIHYQLTLGARYLKGHRLPWEDILLGSRRFDRDCGVFVARPEAELLVLVARTALKHRWRDDFRYALGKSIVSRDVQRELAWLIERVDVQRLGALAQPLVGDAAARMLQRIAQRMDPLPEAIEQFHRVCAPSLSAYRLYAPVSGLIRQWAREVRALAERARRKLVGGLRASPRTPPRGGRIVAIIGADGAGKSTLTGEVGNWLSRQCWVITAYGGSGAGSASLARRSLERLARLTRTVMSRGTGKPVRQTGAASAASSEPLPLHASLTLKNLWKAMWVMSLARERRRRVKNSWRARAQGAVVLADRHPQTQFPGLSDGPQLKAWRAAKSALLRLAAERERRAFEAMDRYQPDVVIKLLVSAEVALGRKPARSEAQLRRKIEVVRALKYPPATRVIEVNADLPLEQVLLQVKRAIWASL